MTMDRITTINQADVERHREAVRADYPAYEKPCPNTRLVNDDHVEWLGIVKGAVVWGNDDPDWFFIYAPDAFLDTPVPVDALNVTDRAPVTPGETPMPIFLPPDPNEEPEGPPGHPGGGGQLAQQSGVKEALDAARKRGKRGKPAQSKQEIEQAIKGVIAKLPTQEARKHAREFFRRHRSDLELGEEG